ncbi:Pentatricopeptide repeat-containing protein [Glycine soja]
MATSDQTLVCVKQVKQEVADEWDESMPLPGDVIEGFSEREADDDSFLPVKASSEFSSQLGKINPRGELIWIQVRRGDSLMKLQVRIVQQKGSILQRKYTIQAATDHRHVADLGDLTLERCNELQEMSMRVNKRRREFRRSGIKYNWKMKIGTYLPDQCCSVISSILFMPLISEYCIDTTTARCMAWFSAAVSSGVPLVFVNIQTEQIPSTEETHFLKREIATSKQKINNANQIMHGIRLWFLPGLAEISVVLIPQPGEARFGMEIKRTEEGFVYIYSVMRGSPADRAGVREMYEESSANRFLLVISRLQCKSIMPTSACSAGLVHCCDQSEMKDILTSAIDQYETIQNQNIPHHALHFFNWASNHNHYSHTPLCYAAITDLLLSHSLSATPTDSPTTLVFEEMPYEPNMVTYNTLIHGFCKKSDMEGATRVFDRLVESKSCKPDVVSFTTLIEGYSKRGDFRDALECLKEIMEGVPRML